MHFVEEVWVLLKLIVVNLVFAWGEEEIVTATLDPLSNLLEGRVSDLNSLVLITHRV